VDLGPKSDGLRNEFGKSPTPNEIADHETEQARNTKRENGRVPNTRVALHVLRVFIVTPKKYSAERHAVEDTPSQKHFGCHDAAESLTIASECNRSCRHRDQQLRHADIVLEHRLKRSALCRARERAVGRFCIETVLRIEVEIAAFGREPKKRPDHDEDNESEGRDSPERPEMDEVKHGILKIS
jgi:hypothetical protein